MKIPYDKHMIFQRMDWEDIDGRSELTDCVSTRRSIANGQKKSPIQGISGLIASRAREETPIRDLAPTLAGLNLRVGIFFYLDFKISFFIYFKNMNLSISIKKFILLYFISKLLLFDFS